VKSDRELQEEVLQQMCGDSSVNAGEIGVTVHDGIATLTGIVVTCVEREAAEAAALCVSGIHDVANDIQLRVPGYSAHTDADLAHIVRHALEWAEPAIPCDRIKACVTDGVVALYGTVDSWQQVAEAEEIVGDLEGVADVDSELTVSQPPSRVATV
jgi:osmotically-inducible protein OsmY